MNEPPLHLLMDLSNLVDEALEEEWVVVKKRRIIIWIPPPTVEPQPGSPEAKLSKPKKVARRNLSSPKKRGRRVSNSRSSKAATTFSEKEVHIEAQLNKSSAAPEQETDHELQNQGPSQNVVSRAAIRTNDVTDDHIYRRPSPEPGPLAREVIKVNSSAHFRRQTALPLRNLGGTPRLPVGGLNFVNHRLRASNFERKLQLLGGLRTWLLSQGLGRFIHIFEREKVGIYQLVNLTMSKLKDMGADAVGPRRKLIHAVECLCTPYYFDGCK